MNARQSAPARAAISADMDFITVFIVVAVSFSCQGQREASLPLTPDSFRQILRSKVSVPEGRSISASDVILRLYSPNTTKPAGYRIRETRQLLADPNFDPQRPTVIYAHGYVELFTDASVRRVMQAYLDNGEYNAVLLDWSNLAFGNYVISAIGLQAVGEDVGKAVAKLLKGGLKLEGLHLVGHSMGAQLLGITGRYLAGKGIRVPRLTGLDPAYPGFYPPLLALAPPMSRADAVFVDALHTDGGGFGAPAAAGAADFWPNEGGAKQPGCLSATVPLTVEDFCSHWRSWEYWAESVAGGEFLARKCTDYDSFLRGRCRGEPTVYMGLKASPEKMGWGQSKPEKDSHDTVAIAQVHNLSGQVESKLNYVGIGVIIMCVALTLLLLYLIRSKCKQCARDWVTRTVGQATAPLAVVRVQRDTPQAQPGPAPQQVIYQ